MSKKEGRFTDWVQWFHNCKLDFCGLAVQSWDGRNLNEVPEDEDPPSLSLNIRWPVGPTAPLIKPKWNVDGKVDPIVFRLSQKDFSLFRFFVSWNLSEASRFISKNIPTGITAQKASKERLVLFGYEKTVVPPTTYSIKLSSDLLQFQFFLDEEESTSRKAEGMMNINASNASWSLAKNADYISKQRANVESICIQQTSNIPEWAGFPDLLLPLPTSTDASMPHPHCLFQFTSTTHPNGNNVKTLHLDAAGIYLIVPAWQHVGDFFRHLPTHPEIFEQEEMSSIMQVGDRFYRMSKSSRNQAKKSSGDIPAGAENTMPPQQVSISKQFLFTLTSPQIIILADSANQQGDCPCVTLSMAHLNFLRQIDACHEVHCVFCDGLEVFTGRSNRYNSPSSSLLCPVSISGSSIKTIRNKKSQESLSGWVWAEELQARAACSDLTLTLTVFNGFKKQMGMPESKGHTDKSIRLAQSTTESSLSGSTNEGKTAASQGRM